MTNTTPGVFERTNPALLRAALLCALVGCNIDYKVVEAEDAEGAAGDGGDGRAGDPPSAAEPVDAPALPSGGAAGDPAPSSTPPSPDGVCRNGGTCLEVAVTNVDTVDLLFMVDDSASMAEEQAALAAELPKIVGVLTTGDRDSDGLHDFPSAKSLHVGVVSSDLGLVGIRGIDRCDGLGDNGVMNDVPSPALMGCDDAYPRFLTYTAGTNDPADFVQDVACIATLGTDGCGFEQPLESALKALWPSDDMRVTFLPDPLGFGATGEGDAIMGGAPGQNAGFLRSDPVQGLSVISVVLLTDEEDCSSSNTSHLRPPAYLDPNDLADGQLLMQGLNTRCHFNPQNLYPRERYINAFKALRPGREELVLFSAIVGVPVESVADVPVDYASNEAARAAFYARIRAHERMQPAVDTRGTPSVDDDAMRPSCDTPMGKAYPPSRIVGVAEGFGANGMVQSICQEDFGPAVSAILERTASRLGAPCLPEPLVRGDDGLVACDVIWALPAPGHAAPATPIACDQAPFLLPVTSDQATTAEGNALCRVAQLAVSGGAFLPTTTDGVTSSEGWYYDDFSDETTLVCRDGALRRIAFTPSAMPPTGVRVYLDCAR